MSVAVGTLSARLRAMLGFSRVLQATFSVAQPLFVAVVALHGFPSFATTVFALTVAYAGYLAVFALNDLSDVQVDRRRFDNLRSYRAFDVDAAMMRHPLAQGLLRYRDGVIWIGVLAAYALVGAYVLSPMAAVLFLVSAALEMIYCRLSKVTAWKFLPTGAMVAVGALAAWFVARSDVDVPIMTALFVWLCCWEIGGRNIVNDWADVEEDVHLGVKTVPVVFGQKMAAWLIFAFLAATVAASLVLVVVSHLNWLYLPSWLLIGYYLLLRPGLSLLRQPEPPAALALFNRASIYPVLMLVGLIVLLPVG